MTNQICYIGTDIPIKVGHIVVVQNGKAFGNTPGTITRVTKVKGFLPNSVVCEDCTNEPKHGNHHLSSYVKTPSYVEAPNDLSLANEEERKTYFENKRKYFEVFECKEEDL